MAPKKKDAIQQITDWLKANPLKEIGDKAVATTVRDAKKLLGILVQP